MIITFTGNEVKSAFACKLRDLGLTNIDENSITVAVKSMRDGSGNTEATVEFTTNSTGATLPTPTEPEQDSDVSTETNDQPDESGNLDTSEQISGIFNSK